MSWDVVLFETSRGECPVEEFLNLQQKSAKVKIGHLFDLLTKHGHMLGVPHAKRLMPDLYELRVRGKEELRIFYTFRKKEVILLHAFKKQTQKTPHKEIDTALKRMQNLT